MLKIKSFHSGSTGNLYTVDDGDSRLLIEAGVTIKRIKKALNFKLNEISSCIVSHQHLDHCKAIPDMIKQGIDCYMLQDVKESLQVTGHRVHVFDFFKQFKAGSFTIKPFGLEHDVPNAGFLIMSGNEKLVYITDTFYCRFRFPKLNYIMLETNYSNAILDENIKNGLVDRSMRKRLLYSHFELENVKDFLLSNDLSRCKEIHLIHLSSANSNAELFKQEIQTLTGIPVYV